MPCLLYLSQFFAMQIGRKYEITEQDDGERGQQA